MSNLAAGRLYGILDLGYVAQSDARRTVAAMIAGGVDLIQFRAKNLELAEIARLAAEIHSETSGSDVPLVINDHAEIARDIGAEGVHVGQNDQSVAAAREIVGAQCLIGKSTHSLEQATRAMAEGADYIGWGPLFATPTKPDYVPIGLGNIAAVHAAVTKPIFCIGGIKLANLPQVIASGARRVVIVSGLLQAANVAEYARAAKALLDQKSEIRNQK
ncbi:MAG: thiamine phosphate synthase [Chthoniobacterales bacterium]